MAKNSGGATVGPREAAAVGVIAMGVFMLLIDVTIVNVALPTLSRELNAGTSALQWIVDAYALVFSCLLLAGGCATVRSEGAPRSAEVDAMNSGLREVAARSRKLFPKGTQSSIAFIRSMRDSR